MLKTLDSNASPDEILQVLNQDGGVIVASLAEDAVVDRVSKELRPHYDAQGEKHQNDFNGYKDVWY